MTREKEIKRRLFEISTSNFNNSVVDSSAYFAGYIDGAQWADNTMIDKACEWLDCYIDNYLFIDAENKAGIRWDDFINNFRNAMKSGSSEFPNNSKKEE